MSDVFDQIHADRTSGKTPSWGSVTGFEHSTGLPIVKRSASGTTKPAETPEAPAEKPESTQPTQEEAGAKEQTSAAAKPAALAKGSAVLMPDGSTGKISYLHQQMRIARVTKDGGGSVMHPISKLKQKEAMETKVPAGHTFVSAHYRPLPEKAK